MGPVEGFFEHGNEPSCSLKAGNISMSYIIVNFSKSLEFVCKCVCLCACASVRLCVNLILNSLNNVANANGADKLKDDISEFSEK